MGLEVIVMSEGVLGSTLLAASQIFLHFYYLLGT